jgi:hypothetical protein
MIQHGSSFLSALGAVFVMMTWAGAPAHADPPAPPATEVHRIRSFVQAGQAFRLTYTVSVPLDLFWKFKTDFGADFLMTNRYILSNRLVGRKNNVYITETRYVDAPQTVFRWQTTVYPSAYRMNYRLLNPEECGQKFNRGSIQLSTVSGNTRVVHSTYFDFFGAAVWARFPGPGGMVGFLRYTAEWEKETIKELQHRYMR